MNIVEGLLEQAQHHVDVHKLFCDREFDADGVRAVVDQHAIQYVIGKKKQSVAVTENIEEITEDPVYDSRTEHVWQHHDGRRQTVSIIYLPGGEYSQFTVNGWVDPNRADALTNQYRQRWRIGNQYESIKEFLPKMSSTDYRVRFTTFALAALIYNLWRLTDYLSKAAMGKAIRSPPVLTAKTFVRVLGNFLLKIG